MADVTLRAVRAKHGDALILFTENSVMLIDGGPSGVYRQFLRKELKKLKDERSPEHALPIDLMMVSHIDADHIDGILDLTDELIEAQDEERTPLVKVSKLWHNSFADFVLGSSDTADKSTSVAGVFEDNFSNILQDEGSQLVLASVAQGRQLRLDAERLGILQNVEFDGKIAKSGHDAREFGDFSVRVIGPGEEEIEDLREKWKSELPKILQREAEAETAAASLDKSVSNLASIVAVIDTNGKSILTMGDARADMTYQWLGNAGLLDENGKVHFDLIKLGHHGSVRNIDKEFIANVTANHYVISGDGGHGNPDPKTLDMIFAERGDSGGEYKIHLTYSPDEIKGHKTYIRKDKLRKLDSVLDHQTSRRSKLNFPHANHNYLDIVLN